MVHNGRLTVAKPRQNPLGSVNREQMAVICEFNDLLTILLLFIVVWIIVWTDKRDIGKYHVVTHTAQLVVGLHSAL